MRKVPRVSNQSKRIQQEEARCGIQGISRNSVTAQTEVCKEVKRAEVLKNKALRLKPKTREEWLVLRQKGIGGSDAAAIVGLSPWKTADALWKEKAQGILPKDISDSEFVRQGVRLEPALRTLFKAKHPEYSVRHEPLDMWYQEGREWLFATLDGRIIDKANKKYGCLEIKTSTPQGKAGWNKWNESIPDGYVVQCYHEMLASGYDFVILFAALMNRENDMTIREYRIDRADVQDELDWLLEKETEFWNSIQSKTIPPMTILI